MNAIKIKSSQIKKSIWNKHGHVPYIKFDLGDYRVYIANGIDQSPFYYFISIYCKDHTIAEFNIQRAVSPSELAKMINVFITE